ncbi:translation initiation factor IF-2 subunit alpha [Saccharolobus islandicus]|uniref:Translation initiation factor 2 subunit alpha n=3 Tax=Saccharolobus islandicus TaxID=43080 RepID=IF2A_SACI3|nr:translation initiation factor IF-2 subunit alpha [Sulfolobus islandicus]C3MYF1.1 RecName: Full=Translation initiation factor 2 subunit alpha; AltName: Full=aIF2-alpha; AltName: Full=eIF-2-alpha [Sulfolobus islandicus M.14.25]C3N545.1 RecName: Full=Translation initiation factor 2 subunit alpha; AltName: Full=aIF2-alpha; AltName: Full=eIF-2-alpha [Sulfolobus islandicus M.16.27]C4KGP8.1 RecName: Full=Translation initiation factor 2 subunit alpha; AltName: Full=aIF2-alpha; AltName: Full=eIF-2-alp
MIYSRSRLPSEGEILIATVKQVFDYGSYVTLDEYGGLQAFLPWSEVSSKWVKNIRDVLKENRKVVVKVIRVDRRKGTVDVSLKKVTDDERRKKNLQWKKIQRLDKILELVSQQLKLSEKDAWEQVAWKLEAKYGDPISAIERAVKEGEKILIDAGVPEIWIKPLLEEAAKHTEEKKVKMSGLITVKTSEPLGVQKIKEVISKALENIEQDYESILNVKIYTIGAPRYRVDVVGTNPKDASEALNQIISNLIKIGKEENVDISVVKK